MLDWLFGRRKTQARQEARKVQALAQSIARRLLAKLDAAQTNDENRRHWANADDLSADAALNPEVRRIVRRRACYEVGNGSYAAGMNRQKANDLIGTGPRLQMLTANEEANERLETEWKRWADATRFARTLRTACRAKVHCSGLNLLPQPT